MKAAHVPAETRFATKPALAGAMIERARAAKTPFGWVAADSVYGVRSLETRLRTRREGVCAGYQVRLPCSVMGQGASHRGNGRSGCARPVAIGLGAPGTKGARLHDWAYLELADLDAADYGSANSGLWTRGLLIRRSIADGDLAFFSTWCPAGTAIETLVKVATGFTQVSRYFFFSLRGLFRALRRRQG